RKRSIHRKLPQRGTADSETLGPESVFPPSGCADRADCMRPGRCSPSPGAHRLMHSARCTPAGVQHTVHSARCTAPGAHLLARRTRCTAPGAHLLARSARCTACSARRTVHGPRRTVHGERRPVHGARCPASGAGPSHREGSAVAGPDRASLGGLVSWGRATGTERPRTTPTKSQRTGDEAKMTERKAGNKSVNALAAGLVTVALLFVGLFVLLPGGFLPGKFGASAGGPVLRVVTSTTVFADLAAN